MNEGNLALAGRGDYEIARCIFCLTGHEQRIADNINADQAAKAIYPVKTKRIRSRGVWREITSPLLPSYVFVYSAADFSGAALLRIPNVIRILTYADDGEGVLTGTDREFADLMWQRRGRVGILQAVRVGSRVEIVDGLFKQLKGRVMAMDRRKQMAKVELDIVGSMKHIWLSFDYFTEEKSE